MTKMCGNRKKSILNITFALLICVLCAIVLCACNQNSNGVKVTEKDYNLHFAGISYSEEDGTMYAVVTLSGDEETEISSQMHWYAVTSAQSVWYNRQVVEMTLNPSLLFKELDGSIAEEQRVKDGVEYNRLKVVLRYDTIYKSVKSEGDVEKSGKYYLHRFYLDEESESETYVLQLKSQNTANWYTILIACGIAFAVVLTGVTLAVKGGIWQKKKKKNE